MLRPTYYATFRFYSYVSEFPYPGLGSRSSPLCNFDMKDAQNRMSWYGSAPNVKISHAVTPKDQTSDFNVNFFDCKASMAVHFHENEI